MKNLSFKTFVVGVAACAAMSVNAQSNANTPPVGADADRPANRVENAADRAADRADRATDAAADKSSSMMEDVKDAFSDSYLATKVKAALFVDENTKARKIQVEARDGTVQLSGFVQSDEEKSQAEAVAQGVEGVQSVQNDIRLSNGRN